MQYKELKSNMGNMFFKEKDKHKSKPDGLQQACNRICMPT